MRAEPHRNESKLFVGIECGATRAVAICADAQWKLIARREAGPANVRLLRDSELRRHLRGLANGWPKPSAICVGMAGARTATDLRRIESAVRAIWGNIPCRATNDLETASAAATLDSKRPLTPTLSPAGGEGESAARLVAARVLILSGTGS